MIVQSEDLLKMTMSVYKPEQSLGSTWWLQWLLFQRHLMSCCQELKSSGGTEDYTLQGKPTHSSHCFAYLLYERGSLFKKNEFFNTSFPKLKFQIYRYVYSIHSQPCQQERPFVNPILFSFFTENHKASTLNKSS